jgi:hypothetical protein
MSHEIYIDRSSQSGLGTCHICSSKQKGRDGVEGRFVLLEYHDKAAQADSCSMGMLFTSQDG